MGRDAQHSEKCAYANQVSVNCILCDKLKHNCLFQKYCSREHRNMLSGCEKCPDFVENDDN